jgi:D-glycero-D-manno-heptose 1,7-bisphosphate phosphatase
MRPALFVDRDGTLIEDVGFIDDPAHVHLLPGVADAVRAFNTNGVPVVVISNQSGVGRGMFDMACVWSIDAEMRRQLLQQNASITASYYCPHHPDDGCTCRKPGVALLRQAAAELDLDLEASWMVGDRQSDLDTGLAAGCHVAALGFEPSDPATRVLDSLLELTEVLV